jgi:hypothetical protein
MSGVVELLVDCEACGIRLQPNGCGGLTIDAPKDTLSTGLLDRLRANKRALLKVLSGSNGAGVENQTSETRSHNSQNLIGQATRQPGSQDRHPDVQEPLGCEWDCVGEPIRPKPAEICSCCEGRRWWRSVYGPHLICGTCHPPALPNLVAEWVAPDSDTGLFVQH